MSLPLRSIRLQRRTADSLNRLSGNSGEIFYDADSQTLRLYTGIDSAGVVFATRTWVANNTFSGDYSDLTGLPNLQDLLPVEGGEITGSLDIGEQLTVQGNVTLGSILTLAVTTTAPETAAVGQFAVADGVNWDPAAKSGTAAYPVFYDGIQWQALY